MWKSVGGIWMLLGVVLTAACCDLGSQDCAADYRAGLVVTYPASASGTCDATVVATEGDFREVLSCSAYCEADSPGLCMDGGIEALCYCSGAGERAGNYLVSVSGGGMTPAQQEVTVRKDDCHVVTETVDFAP